VVVLVLLMLGVLACQPEDLGFDVNDLPDGDAARGAQIFRESINGAPACATCHAVGGSAKSGPSLDNFGAVAADRVDDQDAETYTFYSILRPAKHIVSSYSNMMPSDYADKLSRQDIADLIAYLMSLHSES
jgi:mono/diheme cytochrome c family protein